MCKLLQGSADPFKYAPNCIKINLPPKRDVMPTAMQAQTPTSMQVSNCFEGHYYPTRTCQSAPLPGAPYHAYAIRFFLTRRPHAKYWLPMEQVDLYGRNRQAAPHERGTVPAATGRSGQPGSNSQAAHGAVLTLLIANRPSNTYFRRCRCQWSVSTSSSLNFV